MIYINKDAYISIETEISKHKEVETGGILLGFNFGSDAIVTHAIPARGKSTKMPFYFKNDIKYSRKMEKIYYKKYGVHYLGDWHKHPNNDTNASIYDKVSIFKTSLLNPKMTFFIIVGNDFVQYKNYISIYSLNKNNFKINKNEITVVENIEKLIIQNKSYLT